MLPHHAGLVLCGFALAARVLRVASGKDGRVRCG